VLITVVNRNCAIFRGEFHGRTEFLVVSLRHALLCMTVILNFVAAEVLPITANSLYLENRAELIKELLLLWNTQIHYSAHESATEPCPKPHESSSHPYRSILIVLAYFPKVGVYDFLSLSPPSTFECLNQSL
jgi:hypothetical protein